jgi:hypothetical protein
LDKKTSLDTSYIKQLPLAVVLEKGKKVVVYKVPSENTENYFDAIEGQKKSFESLEEETKRFGEKITPEEFLNAQVSQIQTLGIIALDSEYAIYRAKFKNNP